MSETVIQEKLRILSMPPRASEYVDVGQYYSELANKVREAGFRVEITPDHVHIYCMNSGDGCILTDTERARFMDNAVNLRSSHESSLSLKDAIYGWAWPYVCRTVRLAHRSARSAA